MKDIFSLLSLAYETNRAASKGRFSFSTTARARSAAGVLWLHRRRPEARGGGHAVPGLDAGVFLTDGPAGRRSALRHPPDRQRYRRDGQPARGVRLAGLGLVIADRLVARPPGVRRVCRAFARNRMRIGRLLGRKDDCDGECRL